MLSSLFLSLVLSLTCATVVSPPIPQSVCGTQVKVLTDIEDTLVSVGHLYRGGSVDSKWTRNLPYGYEIYPGILQFHIELARGTTDVASAESITILTPRSTLRGNISTADVVDGNLAKHFLTAGSPRKPELHLGKIDESKFSSPLPRVTAFKNEKVHQQRVYQDINERKYQYVLVGSNGQGDSAVARTLLSDSKSCVKAVFLHDVMPISPISSFGIHMYRTAADAIVKAFEQRLVDQDAIVRVLDAIKNSKQWLQCQKRCQCLNCGAEAISQLVLGRPYSKEETEQLLKKQNCWCLDCQADSTGYAPACGELSKEVEKAELFLQQLSKDCDPSTENSCIGHLWCRPKCSDSRKGECIPYQVEQGSCTDTTTPSCQQNRCNLHSKCITETDTLHTKSPQQLKMLVGTCYDVRREEVVDRNAKALKYRKFITMQFTPGPQPTTNPVVTNPPTNQGFTNTITRTIVTDEKGISQSSSSSSGTGIPKFPENSLKDTATIIDAFTKLFISDKLYMRKQRGFKPQQVFVADDDDDGDDDFDTLTDDDDGDDDDDDDDDDNDDNNNANTAKTTELDDDGDPLNGSDELFGSENGSLWLIIGLGLLALCVAAIVGLVIYSAVSRHDQRMYGPMYFFRKAKKPKIGETEEGTPNLPDELTLAEAITNDISITEAANNAIDTHTTYPAKPDYSQGDGLGVDAVDIQLEERH